MLELGPIVFASPWMLAALASLPILWWLLRVTPPAPLVRAFPPLRLILALRKQEETPARTPLWLILLRMLIAALVILALAHPLWNPGARLAGSGPVLLVIDDGWAAAHRWADRDAALSSLLDRIDRAGRNVRLLTTAPARPGEAIRASDLMRPAEARRVVKAIRPKPWPTDRAAAVEAVRTIAGSVSSVVWLSDGLEDPAAERLALRLQELGALQMILDPAPARARILRAPRSESEGLMVPMERASPGGEARFTLRVAAEDGRMLGREEARFAEGETRAEVHFRLPGEMRNAAARIEMEGAQSAGGVFLMDERWRRRPVGIVSGSTSAEAQPLLAEDYYLQRALQPFSDVHRGRVAELMERELAVVMLADIGKLSQSESDALSDWVKKGGVVVRFAGPRLAQTADDPLIPVRLRGGERAMGGALSWTQPARLMPFDEASPFAGLHIPEDVRIRQQVLAEPTVDLNEKTWVRLSDGTPLVTAEKRERGWLVLVHTTANTDWSNLPLSGLFIEMLQRIVGLSVGVVGDDAAATFPPLETMDGFGVLGRPPATAQAIAGRDFARARPAPATPPGYYGRGDARRALNLSQGVPTLKAMTSFPAGVTVSGYTAEGGVDAKPWLLLAALLLALVDLVISYALRGLGPARRTAQRGATAALVALAVTAGIPVWVGGAQAQPAESEEAFAITATSETRLAYVATGDPGIDTVSRAGLMGLSRMLRQRTAVEPGEPIGVDVERDELAFFPMLYWPISAAQPPLSDHATERLNQYLRSGGTILFDTREQANVTFDPFGTGGPASARLRLVLRGLDVPALTTVPNDHVLTKSFYLLNEFPGRWTGGAVWVERRGGRHNDGVSTVIIGSNDWAGAWAVNEGGSPMLPVAPGGERQRDMAYRFGINWVMYALTGNYKTDQVHVPAIIERLGQ